MKHFNLRESHVIATMTHTYNGVTLHINAVYQQPTPGKHEVSVTYQVRSPVLGSLVEVKLEDYLPWEMIDAVRVNEANWLSRPTPVVCAQHEADINAMIEQIALRQNGEAL